MYFLLVFILFEQCLLLRITQTLGTEYEILVPKDPPLP